MTRTACPPGRVPLAGAYQVLCLAGVERCSPVTDEWLPDRAGPRGDAAPGLAGTGGAASGGAGTGGTASLTAAVPSARTATRGRRAARRRAARPGRHRGQQVWHGVDWYGVAAELEV